MIMPYKDGAVHKKSLFPVQRVAKIVASWAAVIFVVFFTFFLVGKCPFFPLFFFSQK